MWEKGHVHVWRYQGHLEEPISILWGLIKFHGPTDRNQLQLARQPSRPHAAWLPHKCETATCDTRPPFLIFRSPAKAILSASLARYPSQFAEGLSQGCHGPATRVPHKARKCFHWCPYSRAKLPVLQELTQLAWGCLSLEMPACRASDWQAGMWISGQFPPFPDLVRVAHCAEQSFTVCARHVVYAEHLFSFGESGILVYASEVCCVPSPH